MKKVIIYFVFLFCGVLFADSDKANIEDFLFTVECTDGSRGSAFLMKDKDGVWMVSNYHVIAGKGTIEFIAMNNPDQKLTLPDQIQISTEQDAIRFKVDRPDGFMLASDCSFDEEVFAFGNSGGAGIITKSKGTVVGKGRGDVEVSCDIIPGNSGGPIINSSNQVIGIASFIIKPAVIELSEKMLGTMSESQRRYIEGKLKEVKGTRYEDTRRFAICLEGLTWQDVDRDVFDEEAALFRQLKKKFSKLSSITMKIMSCQALSESDCEPVLKWRWGREYNRDVSYNLYYSIFSGGKAMLRIDRKSFYRKYSRALLSFCDEVSDAVEDERKSAEENFTIKYFQKEAEKEAEEMDADMDRLKIIAEGIDP